MESQIHYLAVLGYIDSRLDELHEEFGDLPEVLKTKEKKAHENKMIVKDTENILENIKKFVATTKNTLIELKDKEEKLAKQQFKVRNNKEFDAITKEIAHIRSEHTRLTDQMRTEGIKEENLLGILDQQKKDFEEAENDAEKVRLELQSLATEQNDEVKILYDKRKLVISKIEDKYYNSYERIRNFHPDTVVQVLRNSCSGCFNALPAQKIVEIRNNLDEVYDCESCGRIFVS